MEDMQMTKRSRTELGKTCQSTENTKVEVYLQRPKGLLPKEKDQTEINLCSFLRVVTEKKKTPTDLFLQETKAPPSDAENT